VIDIGLQLPYAVPSGRDDFIAWVRRTEEGPFTTVNLGERVTYDNPDTVAGLAAAAVLTSRVRILANLSVLPLHPSALAAKAFATIDRLSAGRLVVALGVGSREEDFAAAGSTYDNRWQRLDDGVAAMQSMWRGEAAEPNGTVVGPPPVTAGGPPLHCSALGPKALGRAVHWATGYQGFTPDGGLDMLQHVAGTVTAAFADAGKPRPELGVACFFALGADAEPRLREQIGRYFAYAPDAVQQMMLGMNTISTPHAVAQTIANAEAAGFDEIHFNPTTTDLAEIDRLESVLADR